MLDGVWVFPELDSAVVSRCCYEREKPMDTSGEKLIRLCDKKHDSLLIRSSLGAVVS